MNINYLRNMFNNSGKRFDNHKSPDGVIGLSHLVTPLMSITRHGRALDSSREGEMHRMMGDLVASCLPTDATEEDRDNTIGTLVIFCALLMQSLTETLSDICVEEFLADVLNPDSLKELSGLLAATPYVDESGEIIPMIFREHRLFKAIPLTEEQRAGFRRRRIEPYEGLEFNITVDVNDSPTVDGPTVNRLVNLNDFETEEFTADPFNGFDEFWEFTVEDEDDDDNDW